MIGGGDWSKNRLIPDCIRFLLNKKTINIRNPNFNRPWQHVLEPLKGYLMLAKKQYQSPKNYSSAWNFGTTPNSLTSVKSIVKFIIEFFQLNLRDNAVILMVQDLFEIPLQPYW